MNINQMCKLARIYESTLSEIRRGIVKEICERLSNVDLPEAKRVSSSPLVIMVQASTVFSNSWNMSAEYYISETQTKVLIENIKNKTTLSEIVKFIDGVIANGYIRIDGRNKMYINNVVKTELINILKEIQ